MRVKDWQFFQGIPSQDIIWPNVKRLMETNICRRFYSSLWPLLVSAIVIFFILFVESAILYIVPKYASILLWLTSGLFVLFCFFGAPWLVFKATTIETHYLKSVRERLYLARLTFTQITNIFIIPLVYNYLVLKYAPEKL